jgi:hypothetical protein
MVDAADLPKLNDKQHCCLQRYLTNGFKKSEAYRYAYDCSRMSTAAIYVEASKFFKNPKITLWLEYYKQNTEKSIQEELNYSALDYFNDCEELKLIALECRDKQGNPNVSAAIKADENKAKVCGLLKDQIIHSGSVTQMPSVVVNGKELELNIGEEVDANTSSGDA